jgi:hypothetical protein
MWAPCLPHALMRDFRQHDMPRRITADIAKLPELLL